MIIFLWGFKEASEWGQEGRQKTIFFNGSRLVYEKVK
jgi:hypothetical protein